MLQCTLLFVAINICTTSIRAQSTITFNFDPATLPKFNFDPTTLSKNSAKTLRNMKSGEGKRYAADVKEDANGVGADQRRAEVVWWI
jgi:hypothetical protein